jgi:hypothetical protein
VAFPVRLTAFTFQDITSWITAHNNLSLFFGGSTQIIIYGNLRANSKMLRIFQIGSKTSLLLFARATLINILLIHDKVFTVHITVGQNLQESTPPAPPLIEICRTETLSC